MDKKIVCVIGYNSTMGFGNKIFKMLGDILIAKEYYKALDKDIIIYYDYELKKHKVKNDNTNARYEYLCKNYKLPQLFTIPFNIINKNKLEEIINDPNYIILKDNDLRNRKPFIKDGIKLGGIVNGFPIFPIEKEELINLESYEKDFNGTVAFCYDKLPDKYWNKYKKYFNLLKLNPEINIELENLDIGKWTLGVHIRRGDFQHYCIKVKDRSTNTDDKFIVEIDRKLKDGFRNIFLSSDDQDLQKRFKKKYGDKLIFLDTDNNIRDERLALKCITLLSRCGYLILSHLSSFSELAWWLSDNRINISYIS